MFVLPILVDLLSGQYVSGMLQTPRFSLRLCTAINVRWGFIHFFRGVRAGEEAGAVGSEANFVGSV